MEEDEDIEAGNQDLLNAESLDDLLHAITRRARQLCDTEKASILLVDPDRGDLVFRVAADQETLSMVRVPSNNSSIAGACLVSRRPVVVQNVAEDDRHFKGSDAASEFTTRSILAVPMVAKGDPIGVLEAINKRDNRPFVRRDEQVLSKLADLGASILRHLNEMDQLRGFFNFGIQFLADVSDGLAGSPGRSQRIAEMCRAVGRKIALPQDQLDRLWMACYCHDVGRLVLASKGIAYDPIQSATLGADLASSVEMFSGISEVVAKMWERVDGSGLPRRLREDDIPIEAQLLGMGVDLENVRRSAIGLESDDLILYFIQRSAGRFPGYLLKALRLAMVGGAL